MNIKEYSIKIRKYYLYYKEKINWQIRIIN